MDLEPTEENVLPCWREVNNIIKSPRIPFVLFVTFFFTFKENKQAHSDIKTMSS